MQAWKLFLLVGASLIILPTDNRIGQVREYFPFSQTTPCKVNPREVSFVDQDLAKVRNTTIRRLCNQDLDPTDLGLDSGQTPNPGASTTFKGSAVTSKASDAEKTAELLLLVRKGFFALDLVLQFH